MHKRLSQLVFDNNFIFDFCLLDFLNTMAEAVLDVRSGSRTHTLYLLQLEITAQINSSLNS